MSDDELQRALQITLAARTRHAIREHAIMVFVETREMAALLGISFGEGEMPDEGGTGELDVKGFAQAQLELRCEEATQEYIP